MYRLKLKGRAAERGLVWVVPVLQARRVHARRGRERRRAGQVTPSRGEGAAAAARRRRDSSALKSSDDERPERTRPDGRPRPPTYVVRRLQGRGLRQGRADAPPRGGPAMARWTRPSSRSHGILDGHGAGRGRVRRRRRRRAHRTSTGSRSSRPVELDVSRDADGVLRIGSTPPLYYVDTSMRPSYHRLRFRAELDEDVDGG